MNRSFVSLLNLFAAALNLGMFVAFPNPNDWLHAANAACALVSFGFFLFVEFRRLD